MSTQKDSGHPGALSDLRVVEMGELLAGPFAGQLFADFGAEVIKLEPPDQGDPMREWGREKPHGKSLWWSVRGAQQEVGHAATCARTRASGIARDMIATSDLLIENFRPGTLERWNLVARGAVGDQPQLVILRVTGFGQTGPMAPQAGYGAIGEAMGGLRYVIGEPDRMPSRAGVSIGDTLAATFGALGALMALHARAAHRPRPGRRLRDLRGRARRHGVAGQRVRQGRLHPRAHRVRSCRTSRRPTSTRPATAWRCSSPATRTPCSSGWPTRWAAPSSPTDERYATHTARGQHQTELDDLIADWTRTLTADEVEARMTEHGVPHGKIFRAPDMLEDAHFKAREAIVRVMHQQFGDLAMQNTFPKLSDTPGEVRWIGPELGEHTDQVLTDVLGLSPGDIAKLRELDVV